MSGPGTLTAVVAQVSTGRKWTLQGFLIVAATVIVPYALWPLILVWAIAYISLRGARRLIAALASEPVYSDTKGDRHQD